MIEIVSLRYPLQMTGRVCNLDFMMLGRGDTWCFYISDPIFTACDQLFTLQAKMPCADQMPPPLAITIAKACAKHFERVCCEETSPDGE